MHRLLLVLGGAALMLSLPSCGPGNNSSGGCRAELLAGDLVITEIMANPDGTDTGNEWFEIYNASGRPLDLTGLRLLASRDDGTGEKSHAVAGLDASTGDYVVVGSSAETELPAHLDYSYGTSLGSLRNSGGRVALRCGDIAVDEVTYATTGDGSSLSFTGAVSPDYLANDDAANWCRATVEYDVGSNGSPGMANEVCEGGPAPTECNDAGTVRPIVSPGVGDLVISELMPNPAAANDDTGEWFEVYVGRDVDLNGVEVGEVPGTPRVTLGGVDCIRAAAGSYLVFARSSDPALNGGLPSVTAEFSFGMTNSGESVYVGVGGTVLDTVTWTSSGSGVSTSLGADSLDPTANDDETNWCPSETAYGAGDLGTPGAANPSCPLIPPPGSCVEAGITIRPIDPPAAGDVTLTEFMANPSRVDDTAGEWIEVRVNRLVDLNGLELGTDPVAGTVRHTVQSNDCITIPSGSYAVFARLADPALNGGVTQVDGLFGFSLVNSNAGLFVGHGGTIIDQLTYVSTANGAATALEPGGAWCPATTAYGAGDLGTPGSANPDNPGCP